jgi:hypothetical protein
VDWIELIQGRIKLWAFVNVVMNPRVPRNAGFFFTAEGTTM